MQVSPMRIFQKKTSTSRNLPHIAEHSLKQQGGFVDGTWITWEYRNILKHRKKHVNSQSSTYTELHRFVFPIASKVHLYAVDDFFHLWHVRKVGTTTTSVSAGVGFFASASFASYPVIQILSLLPLQPQRLQVVYVLRQYSHSHFCNIPQLVLSLFIFP